jgi:hypothetical protein
MSGKLDLLEFYERDHTSYTRETLLTHSPMIVTYSEIEVMAPSNFVTSSPQLRPSILGEGDSNTTDVLTCSSTTTDDMLDTVDDCVGCVNQISLQHDFEDSLRDVALNLHKDSNGTPILLSDDETIDIASNIAASEVESLFRSTTTVCNKIEEQPQQHSEMDLLNWCSGGFNGVNPSQ